MFSTSDSELSLLLNKRSSNILIVVNLIVESNKHQNILDSLKNYMDFLSFFKKTIKEAK